MNRTIRFAASLIAALFVTALLNVRGLAQPLQPPLTRNAALEQLFNLKPAERMQFASKVLKKDDFAAVDRGPISSTVSERARVEAIKTSDIISRVRWLGKTADTIISWVVEDGVSVKKGDKLIEFLTTPYIEALNKQKQLTAAAEANLRKADEQLTRIQRDAAIDVKLAEIDVKIAELAWKQYKGNDEFQKQILHLQVDRASLLHERIKLQADVRKEVGAAERHAKKTLHDRELARQAELEANIANCVMHAPHDGIVVYYNPPQGRPGASPALIAQGEPVREGQKLLTVCDLTQFGAVTRINESWIARVKVGQKVAIRIDAFPQKLYMGKVTYVANVADQDAFFNRDVKVYSVRVSIDANNDALRPGMTAENTITTAERAKVLRIPATAIITRDRVKYAYVQVDKELQLRKLKIDLADAAYVEVIEGLKEGESVLRIPAAVADRLVTSPKK